MLTVLIRSGGIKDRKLEELQEWATELRAVHRELIIENLVTNENTILFDASFESLDDISSQDIKSMIEKFVAEDEYFKYKPNVFVIEAPSSESNLRPPPSAPPPSAPPPSAPPPSAPPPSAPPPPQVNVEIVSKPSPPFTVKSVVKLCWGMTLNLSHIKQQNEIGSELNKQLFSLLGENIDKAFLRNLIMVLSQSLRTIAFSRDAHVRHLNEKALSLTEKEIFWNELTQLASFSKEGLPVQILAFLGGGSAGVLNFISQLINPRASEAISNATHALQPSSSLEPIFITNFILYGVIGVIVATFVLKAIGWFYIRRQKKKVEKGQNDYYKDRFINDMIESLYNFYVDIKDLTDKYYPSYPDINEFKGQTEDQIKSYIRHKILPSDKIEWSRWLK